MNVNEQVVNTHTLCTIYHKVFLPVITKSRTHTELATVWRMKGILSLGNTIQYFVVQLFLTSFFIFGDVF